MQPSSSEKFFSTQSEFNTTPNPSPAENPRNSSKFVIGSALIGGALFVAYRNGYLDQYTGGKQHIPLNLGKDDTKEKHVQNLGLREVSPPAEEVSKSDSVLEHAKQEGESQTVLQPDVPTENQEHEQSKVEDKPDEQVEEVKSPTLEKGKTENCQISTDDISDRQHDEISPEMKVDKMDAESAEQVKEATDSTADDDQSSATPQESSVSSGPCSI